MNRSFVPPRIVRFESHSAAYGKPKPRLLAAMAPVCPVKSANSSSIRTFAALIRNDILENLG
jgi:hypothetical protein